MNRALRARGWTELAKETMGTVFEMVNILANPGRGFARSSLQPRSPCRGIHTDRCNAMPILLGFKVRRRIRLHQVPGTLDLA